MLSSKCFGWAGSWTLGSFPSTSLILAAETAARGTIINTMESIKNAMIICMEYCIKAIMSPTWIPPFATWCAPIQTTSKQIPFMIKVIAGIKNTITRFVNNCVLLTSIFALSKRFFSKSSVPKALITVMPFKFSLATKFSLSINFCIILNLGIAMTKMTPTNKNSSPQAKAIIQLIEGDVFTAIAVPPIAITGA